MTLGAATALMLAASAGLAQAITLELPGTPAAAMTDSAGLTSFPLPIGPFTAGAIPVRRVEGQMTRTAWRLEGAGGQTTLDLLRPLRAQLQADGFRLIYECEAAECGGYDFRYGTPVLPEPEMHVDLGDYRYLAAERGAEVVSLIVSRSGTAGFVQMTQVGPEAASGDTPPRVLTASTMDGILRDRPETAGSDRTLLSARPALPQDMEAALLTSGSVALDDLVFASGTSGLAEGDYASLDRLAEWLRKNPEMTVALVGHTDASGGLETNIALARKRAEAVRQVLIGPLGIPAAQVEAQGVGYLAPRASNQTPEGREKNRRVEAVVTSTPASP